MFWMSHFWNISCFWTSRFFNISCFEHNFFETFHVTNSIALKHFMFWISCFWTSRFLNISCFKHHFFETFHVFLNVTFLKHPLVAPVHKWKGPKLPQTLRLNLLLFQGKVVFFSNRKRLSPILVYEKRVNLISKAILKVIIGFSTKSYATLVSLTIYAS